MNPQKEIPMLEMLTKAKDYGMKLLTNKYFWLALAAGALALYLVAC